MDTSLCRLEWDTPNPGGVDLMRFPWVKGRVVNRAILYHRHYTKEEYWCLYGILYGGMWRFHDETEWRSPIELKVVLREIVLNV